ncbi:hypothetical protein ACIGZH_37990 [Streptomyces sp. NPDC058319]|uniref:hypothetical protein n=1 Tax=unclassified Streptomyces TaxID=2593676 RepID=UPI0036E831A3
MLSMSSTAAAAGMASSAARAASVFLARRARGGNSMNQYLRAHGKLHDFELPLDAITDELRSEPLTDYRQCREARNSWALEEDVWRRMVTHLPFLPGHRASISDDRKRLAVSVDIWMRVTGGELEFAPCPPHIANDPKLGAVWSRQRHNVCHWLKETDTRDGLPCYRALKPLLDDHAEQLAMAIDRTGFSTLPVHAARTTLASRP